MKISKQGKTSKSQRYHPYKLQNDGNHQLHTGKVARQQLTHIKLICEHALLCSSLCIQKEETPSQQPTHPREGQQNFTELTYEQLIKVQAVFWPTNLEEILVSGFGQNITRADLRTLHGPNWLNDEIINFYMNLLMEKGKEKDIQKIHAFSSFFYSKLLKEGYASVNKWTKKINIFEMDLVLVPVHMGNHWCLAVIDMRNNEIKYYDSLGGTNYGCLITLAKYLADESMVKLKIPLHFMDFKLNNLDNIPQQTNNSDCGVFVCKFAEYITRGADINFTQEDMPRLRQTMTYEILQKKLL